MKVKELIELLSGLDQEKEIWKSNWYHENSKVSKVELDTFTSVDHNEENVEVTSYVIN